MKKSVKNRKSYQKLEFSKKMISTGSSLEEKYQSVKHIDDNTLNYGQKLKLTKNNFPKIKSCLADRRKVILVSYSQLKFILKYFSQIKQKKD